MIVLECSHHDKLDATVRAPRDPHVHLLDDDRQQRVHNQRADGVVMARVDGARQPRVRARLAHGRVRRAYTIECTIATSLHNAAIKAQQMQL